MTGRKKNQIFGKYGIVPPQHYGSNNFEDYLVLVGSRVWLSIISDEATDISHNEQLCLSVRWADNHYLINEDTLGLVILKR